MKPTNENRTDLKKAVLSLLWSHCGGIIVALIFCIGMSPLLFGNGLWISTPIVLLVYSLPVYRTMWEIGHADLNRAHFGHITLNRWRGIQIGLLAMIPFFLTGVFFLLSKAGLFPNFVVLYKFLNAELWPVINLIQISMYLPDYNWFQAISNWAAGTSQSSRSWSTRKKKRAPSPGANQKGKTIRKDWPFPFSGIFSLPMLHRQYNQ